MSEPVPVAAWVRLETVRPAAPKTFTIAVIIFARSHAYLDNTCVAGIEHTPDSPS